MTRSLIHLLLFVFCSFHFTSVQAQVTNGLVAKYSFFGNANDEIGNNHGTVNGATLTTDRFGIPNRAYQFDGTSGHSIQLGNSSTLKPTACSISLWAYIENSACYQNNLNYQPFIVTTNSNAPAAYYEAYGLGYWLPQPQMLTIAYQGGSSGGSACFSNPTIVTGQWYHMVFSFDNDSMVTYLNNSRICGLAKGFVTTYDGGDVILGKTSVPSKDAYLNGRLDDIRIYNRRLTQQEVDTLFQLPSVNPASIHSEYQEGGTSIFCQGGNLIIQSTKTIQQVQVFDITGKRCLTFEQNKLNVYPVHALPLGVYLCRATCSDGHHVTSKVLLR
ncbi:MAG: T9SS type A sorting domain-containing protein [Chitinophagaceae bacterium]|nr:T9SS type A sorting domain-containing protein [Chitinophagaceae bacterium]